MAVAEEGKLKCFVPNIPQSIMRGYENASFFVCLTPRFLEELSRNSSICQRFFGAFGIFVSFGEGLRR